MYVAYDSNTSTPFSPPIDHSVKKGLLRESFVESSVKLVVNHKKKKVIDLKFSFTLTLTSNVCIDSLRNLTFFLSALTHCDLKFSFTVTLTP